ncbi:MAG: transporter [Chlamydiae bacterium RIFCSPHIGHO2_12_FULL_49_9]|nr:MAG: transporter [Chlamydiae bacterium RIFCSPHIGHO2_12_FULL_49_9]
MLNLSVMVSLRNLPIVAEYGFGSSFFYLFVALVFLFPSALVSAELATGWTRTGGIYVWVREAFGPGWGFFAVWMQWVHNVTWFPAILSFSGAAIAYLFQPELAQNKFFLIGVILAGFWGFTIFNCFGLKNSSWFSSIGVIAGTIVPGILLIALAGLWIVKGNPLQVQLATSSVIPPLDNLNNLVFLTGLFLAFGGLEVSAVHAREVHDPQKTFPRAIVTAATIALVLYAFGALSVAIMIPQEKISFVSSLMEAFKEFFGYFEIDWLLVPVGIMIVWGAVAELNAWIIGPVRALHATSKHGDLPPFFQKLNKHKMPTGLLLFQGVIVSIAAFVFLFMPSASSAFWILSAMSAQLYLVMYVLMFLSAIKLRYSHPHVVRTYRIPYHMPGIWFVGTLGALSSAFAFFIGFVPPGQIEVGNLWFYESFLIGGIALMSLIPYIIYRFRDPSWHPEIEEEKIY